MTTQMTPWQWLADRPLIGLCVGLLILVGLVMLARETRAK